MKNPFVARLGVLHERAKKNLLHASERTEYARLRSELGRLLLVAQQVGQHGTTLRSALRVSVTMKAEVAVAGGTSEQTTTVDVGEGGFAALLPKGHPLGQSSTFTLRLPGLGGGPRPVTGTARVASSHRQGGVYRVSFALVEMSAEDRELLAIAVIDAILARFRA